jgi:hypothetical protein
MAVDLTVAVPTVEIAALTVVDVRLPPPVTVVAAPLRVSAEVTPLLAADRAVAVRPTVEDHPTAVADPTVEAVGRMAVEAADMGGNTTLASFRA